MDTEGETGTSVEKTKKSQRPVCGGGGLWQNEMTKQVLETTAAEWHRATATIGRGPMVATVHLPLTAGDDDDRHLPGH